MSKHTIRLAEQWSRIISKDKDTQDSFKSQHTMALDGVAERYQSVIDLEPDFFKSLMFIVSGDERFKPSEHESDKLAVDEKRRRSKSAKDKMLASFSADEIKGLCRSRYSLMALEDFLLILNKMNSASSGNLLKDKS